MMYATCPQMLLEKKKKRETLYEKKTKKQCDEMLTTDELAKSFLFL